MLDLVGLLDLDADAYAVDAGLNEHALVLVARNGQGCQEHLGRRSRFDLGDIVSLGGLRRKVGETEGGRQAAPDSLEVWAEGLRLRGTEVSMVLLLSCIEMRLVFLWPRLTIVPMRRGAPLI